MKKFMIAAAALPFFASAAIAQNYDDIDPSGAEITVWYRQTRGEAVALDAIIASFNATNPYGITVTGVSAGGYGEIYDKVMNLIGTDELPNIAVGYQNQAAAWENADALIDLQPLFDSEKWAPSEQLLSEIAPGKWDAGIHPDHGGARLGFPTRTSMDVMAVNLDWLAELGLDVPSNPTELIAAACAASASPFSKTADAETAPIGMMFAADASRLGSFIFAQGGEVFDIAEDAFMYDSEESMAAGAVISEMAEKGCLRMPAERYGETSDFGNGVAMMILGSSSGMDYWAAATAEGSGHNWTVVPLPHVTAEPVVNQFGPDWNVFESTPEEEVASFLWMQHWAGALAQAYFITQSDYYPANLASLDMLEAHREAKPQWAAGAQYLPYGKIEASVAAYQNVRRLAGPALAEIIEGGDYMTILEDLAIEANEALEESRQ